MPVRCGLRDIGSLMCASALSSQRMSSPERHLSAPCLPCRPLPWLPCLQLVVSPTAGHGSCPPSCSRVLCRPPWRQARVLTGAACAACAAACPSHLHLGLAVPLPRAFPCPHHGFSPLFQACHSVCVAACRLSNSGNHPLCEASDYNVCHSVSGP